MNKKMTMCKTCGAEIAKSAKVCPKCGARKKLNLAATLIVGILVFFLSFVITSAVLDADENQTASNSQSNNINSNGENSSFKSVSGTVNVWEITVTDFSFQDDINNTLLTAYKPEEGSRYCIVNMTIKNTGTEGATFLNLINGETAKIIYGEYTYTSTVLIGYTDDLHYKALNPLEQATGIIAFSIPESVINSEKSLTLQISFGSDYLNVNLE